MRPARILILEDNWLLAADMADRLERAGHQVVGPFHDADSAQSNLDGIDAAIVDFSLRHGTSAALIGLMTERAIPFAIVSGHQVDLIQKAVSAPIVLSKPLDTRKLVRTLKMLLDRPGPVN